MAKKYVDHFKFNDTNDMIYVKDAEAHTEIDKLTQQVTTEIDKLTQQVTEELNTVVKNNNYIANNFKNGNMLLFGDSYCVDSNTSLTPGWNDGQGFGKLISNKFSMTLYNYAVSGSGFGDYNASNYLIQTQNAVAKLTDDQKNNVKLILYAGGANDGDQSAEIIYSRILSCYNLCLNSFPNAKILCCFIGWSRNGATFEYFKRARTKWKKGCAYSGMPIAHGTEWACHHWDYVGTDNLHPTPQGQSNIANYIMSALFNNGIVTIEDIEDKKQFSLYNLGATSIEGKGFKCSILGDTCTFTNSKTVFGFGSKSVNFNGVDLYQVASIHSYINGGIISEFGTGQQGTYNPCFYAQTMWYVSGQTFNNLFCMSKFMILDGSLWVSPFYTDGGMTKTFTVGGFEMFPATVTCSLDNC